MSALSCSKLPSKHAAIEFKIPHQLSNHTIQKAVGNICRMVDLILNTQDDYKTLWRRMCLTMCCNKTQIDRRTPVFAMTMCKPWITKTQIFVPFAIFITLTLDNNTSLFSVFVPTRSEKFKKSLDSFLLIIEKLDPSSIVTSARDLNADPGTHRGLFSTTPANEQGHILTKYIQLC